MLGKCILCILAAHAYSTIQRMPSNNRASQSFDGGKSGHVVQNPCGKPA